LNKEFKCVTGENKPNIKNNDLKNPNNSDVIALKNDFFYRLVRYKL